MMVWCQFDLFILHFWRLSICIFSGTCFRVYVLNNPPVVQQKIM